MRRSEHANLQLFLERLTARSVLADEEREAILALPTHLLDVRAKQDFVHINEEATYSCFIASGMVGRFGQTASGTRQTTAFHIPGDMADLNSAVRPLGVGGLNALCDTTILRVSHTALRTLAARYPAVAEALWRDCMLDAAILMQWVVNIGRRDARARLAHILCEMSVRMGGDREILLAYPFPITQEQLGEAAAMTAVHVNRSLRALRAEGLATVRRGTVQIHDWDRLSDLGDFEANYLVGDTAPERQKRLLKLPER